MSTKTPVISILVPVYNVEAYLQRCIDSVLAQDFTDWEMILIDDGSPDKCPEICDEAARKDDRIRVIHKENGGIPSARLAGFEQAKGEYLVFLDSDDYLLPNALTTLFDAITSDKGYDLVRAIIQRCDSQGQEWLEHYEMEDGIITSNQDFIKALYQGKMAPYIHSGIYKKNLFSRDVFQVLIDNNLNIGDDAIMTTIIAFRINYVKCINTPVSVYYLNNESIVNSVVRSIDYNQRIRKVLKPYMIISGDMENALTEMAVLEDMKSFFMPELPFDWDFYKKNRRLLSELQKSMYNTHPSRYYFAIDYPIVYYIYTRLFCFLYRWLKLKGHKRRIVW